MPLIFRLLPLALAALGPSLAPGKTCLPEGFPPANQTRLVPLSNGKGVAFDIALINWASARMMAYIFRILVREKLGYNATITLPCSTSKIGFYAVAGCAKPLDYLTDPQCGPTDSNHHVVFELWSSIIDSVWESFSKTNPKQTPLNLKSVGYQGSEGLYVLGAQIDKAWKDEGLSLEWYRSYDASKHNPSRYFDKVDSFDASRVKYCTLTRLVEKQAMSTYFSVTGDAGGVKKLNRAATGAAKVEYHGNCWNQRMWFSPACRATPSSCIPTFTGGASGWEYSQLMQKAAAFNMPIAMMVGASYSEYQKLPQDVRSLTYYWTPNSALHHLSPKAMIFPAHDKAAWGRGDKTSAGDQIRLDKYAWQGLETEAPDALAMIREFVVYDIDNLLTEGLKTSEETASCNWLLNNRNTWEKWIPVKTKCELGRGLVDQNGAFVATRIAADRCEWCQAGRFSQEVVDTYGVTRICVECQLGTSQPDMGKDICTVCDPGSYTSSRGQRECTLCELGRFQVLSNQSSCDKCPATKTTKTLATRKSEDCVCIAGYTRIHGDCEPCVRGLFCPFQKLPSQAEGYWVNGNISTGHFTVLECRMRAECPAGGLSQCASGRTGRACGSCEDDHYPTDGGECRECTGVSKVTFPMILCVLPFAIIFLVIASNYNMVTKSHNQATFIIVFGQLVTTLQTLNVFQQLSIPWEDPATSLFKVLSLFALNVDFLQASCAGIGSSGVWKYAVRVFAFPITVVFIICTPPILRFATARIGPQRFIPALTMEHSWNTIGVMAMALYITLMLNTLVPFQCNRNPKGSMTMSSDRTITCYEGGEHDAFIGLGVLGFLMVPLPLITVTIWATLKYPALMKGNYSGTLMIRCRWLFGRFAVSAYWYGLVWSCRSTLLSLIPVVFVHQPLAEALTAVLVLTGSALTQCWIKPWRTKMANYMDATVSFLLIVISATVVGLVSVDWLEVGTGGGNTPGACSPSGTTTADTNTQGPKILSMVVFVVTILALCALLLMMVLLFIQHMNKKKHFGAFLCHHKGGGGVLARFFKITMARYTKAKVFLDSDNLEDLDVLFDIVRIHTQNLVILLTSETLKRIWCAGEIVTSLANKVKIVPVACDDYEAPDDVYLEKLDSIWSVETQNALIAYGIDLQKIKSAYTQLRGLEPMYFQRFASTQSQLEVISDVVRMCDLGQTAIRGIRTLSVSARRTNSSTNSSGNDVSVERSESSGKEAERRTGNIAIVGNSGEPEARCICQILREMLRRILLEEAAVIFTLEEQEKNRDTTKLVLVVLTKGLLREPSFAQVLLDMTEMQRRPSFFPIGADASFDYPSLEFYEEVKSCGLPPALGPEDGARLSQAYTALMKMIAKPLSPLGSMRLMEAQVADICERLQRAMIQGPTDKVASYCANDSARLEHARFSALTGETLEDDVVSSDNEFPPPRPKTPPTWRSRWAAECDLPIEQLENGEREAVEGAAIGKAGLLE